MDRVAARLYVRLTLIMHASDSSAICIAYRIMNFADHLAMDLK